MFKTKASIVLVASALLVLSGTAMAEPGNGNGKAVTTTAAGNAGAVTEHGLVQRYMTLAGSAENAKSLVNGLRAKDMIVLVGPSLDGGGNGGCTGRFCKGGSSGNAVETIEFVPATESMGFGNVDIALALAEADLKAKSVTTVKPRHLKAALMGGEAGGASFDGVLALRAAGSGWGEIAKSLGFELK